MLTLSGKLSVAARELSELSRARCNAFASEFTYGQDDPRTLEDAEVLAELLIRKQTQAAPYEALLD